LSRLGDPRLGSQPNRRVSCRVPSRLARWCVLPWEEVVVLVGERSACTGRIANIKTEEKMAQSGQSMAVQKVG